MLNILHNTNYAGDKGVKRCKNGDIIRAPKCIEVNISHEASPVMILPI